MNLVDDVRRQITERLKELKPRLETAPSPSPNFWTMASSW
jgi:hypothetical protein